MEVQILGSSLSCVLFIHSCNCKINLYFFIFLFTGGGTVFVLDILQDGIHLIQSFEYNNGLFDVAWAEDNENILLTAGGDGSIQIWDVAQPQVCC